MVEYNYFSSYGDYGSPTTLIPKKTVEDITANAPKEMDTFKEVADKINSIEGGGGGSSADIEAINQKIDGNKSAADAKFEEIDAALGEKADASELDNLATKDELEQVKTDVQTIIEDAPESLDTLKEIADLLAEKENAADVVTALSTKVDTTDFDTYVAANDEAIASINETVAGKVDSDTLEDYATKEYVDGKVDGIAVPTALSELTNDGNYVQDASYVHTDINFTQEMQTKLNGLENYDDKALAGRVSTLENADFLTTETGDERYVQKSQYEDDMELKADKSELGVYATDAELASTVHDLVVRLNKLEAQNSVLIEKSTDSADDITSMSDNDALNADIVVATNEAIEALSTPKTFNSISIAGGELGSDAVINLLATNSVDVNGMTVSGTKGDGNGKIVYGTNDITISNLNIEPGCTVYNVFEGVQDGTADNLVENFTATNVTVDDIDLTHNVFNIYQVADGANIVVKDSSFNLNVANSNVMRVSNITNAKNVNITFENVDWTYENKPYEDGDVAYAGLLIYQPFGNDVALTGDTSNTKTWTVTFRDCRYNGELIDNNNFGTIKQAAYQYKVNNGGVEGPSAFKSVNFE